MTSSLSEASPYHVAGGPRSLSNQALGEILRATLAKNLPFRFMARGFSMHPFIQDGDLLTISPLGGRRLRRGEVVAFGDTATGRLAVHRIRAGGPGGYLVGGDASPYADGVVSRDNILGVVIRVERQRRRVRFGLGPERVLIAWFTSCACLQFLIMRLRLLLHSLRRGATP